MAEEAPTTIGLLDPTSGGALDQALALIDAELGDGLYSLEDLRISSASPTAIVLGAWQDETVVAIAVGRLQVAADVEYYAAFGDSARRAFAAGPVGSLEALAVAPRARRRGLGAELIGRRVDWFREKGCAVAVAIAWLPATHLRGYSAPLFRELGFSETAPVPDFYLEESARDGWSCPADGNPCRCAAIFFWIEIISNQPLI